MNREARKGRAYLGIRELPTYRTYGLVGSDRDNERFELAAAFGSLGSRRFLSLFGPLGWLLWMLDRPLLVIRLPPSIVSSPVEAGSLLSFFCAFGRLLGVLRPLFAHGVSSFFLLRRVAGKRFQRNSHDAIFVGPSQANFGEFF